MNNAQAARWRPAVIVGVAALLANAAALAQGFEDLLSSEADIRSQGWAQLADVPELLDYCRGLLEIFVLTLVVSLHPASTHSRRSLDDFERPRTLFLYALIGMMVGFLVLHHGYIIGFVIFGIGGFLRFRADSISTRDTTRLIIMTLLGLMVGLNLPVIAFVSTIGGWLAVYLISRHEKLRLEVRFAEATDVPLNIDRLSALLAERGYRVLGVTRPKFNPTAEFVLESERDDQRGALIDTLKERAFQDTAGIADWHVG